MSTDVENRVVQMQFNNAQFEKAVQVTLNTLDKLKQKLNFSNSQKSLEGLANSANKVSFEGMATNLDYISGRFTNLGIVGVTALQNITNSAINAGKQLVASLTIDPISMGFQEYETQINAIQTILANTKSKGTTITDVNSALDELNEYADKTIYNFTEMTRNIGTFTAAGVDLDTSVSAIKGIANLAAISGSTSQQASTAMYQLSQALAAGRVSLMDWNSVVNAGMGGEIFQESLKETSRVLGTGVDEAIAKYGTFRESLTQGGWLTTEVLTQTLAKFTGDLTEDQLRSIGYSEEQIKGILELGQTANDAATKIKTFTQLFDTLKESAQSGWAQSWEIIVGDFEEAKELLTTIGDSLTGFINNISNARNAVLQFWKDSGGRTAIIEGIANLLKFIGPLIQLVGAQFNRVFKFDIGQALVDVSNKFFEFTDSLSISAKTIYNIQKTALGFATALSWVGSAAKTVVSVLAGLALDNLLATFSFLVQFVLNLTGAIGDFIVGIQNFFNELRSMESVKRIFGKTADAAENLYEGFQDARDGLFDFILGLESDVLSGAADLLGWIAEAILAVVGAIDKVVVAVMDWVNAIKELPAFQKAVEAIQNGIDKFKNTLTSLKRTVSDVFGNFGDNAIDVFSNFLELIGKVKDGVSEFIKKVLETEEAQKVITGFKDAVEKSFENINNAIKGTKEFFEGFINTVKSINSVSFDEVSSNLGAFKNSASSTLSEIFNGGSSIPSDAGDGSGNSIFDSLANLVYNTTSVSGGLMNTAKSNITKLITFFQQQFAGINFGDVIAAGAGGSMIMFMVSLSNAVNLVSSKLAAFLGIGESFTKIFDGVAGVVVEAQKYVKAQTLAIHANSIMTIAQAIALLAASIGALTLVDQEKLKSSALTLGLLAGGLIALVTIMSVVQKQLSLGDTTKMGLTMLAMSGSLLIMTASLKVLDTIDTNGMVSKLAALLTMVTFLGAVAVVVSKFSGGKGLNGILSMIAMAGSLMILTGSLYVLSKMSAADIAKSLIALISTVGIFSLLMVAVSKVKPGSAAGMLAASASLLILAKSMEAIFNLDVSNLGNKIVALYIVVSTFGALMLATSLAGANALKGGIGILAMSAAIVVLTEAIKRLAELDKDTLSKATDAVVQLLGVFVLLTASTLFAGPNAAKAGLGILAMSGAMILLSASIAILSRIEPDKLDNAVNAIIKLEAMFALLIAATYLAKDCEKTLVTIGVIIAGLAAVLLIASLVEPSRLEGATAAISSLMLCMALLVASTNVAGKANAAMVLMMLAVAELAGLIYLLAGLETGRAIEASASLSLLLVSFSGAMAILQFIQPAAAIKGVAGLIAVVAIIGVFVGAIGALAQQIPQLESFLDSGIPILEKIGYAIGSFIGNIVGGFAAGATSGLGEVANNLSEFMNNIQGFIDGVRNVDQSVVDGASRLALAISSISFGEFMNKLGGGSSGIEEFANSTSMLAEGLNNFFNNIGEIDLEKTSTAAEAIRNLASIDTLLTKEGGFMQGFLGSSGMGTFASNLETLGNGLKTFAETTNGIDASGSQGAIDIAKALGELNNALPATGGRLQEMLGSQDMWLFADNLPKLGEALRDFSTSVTGIEAGNAQGAIEIANALAELNNNLPETGGRLQELLGSNDLWLFAENLPKLGEALKNFSISTNGIDASGSQGAIDIANALKDLNNALPETGGFLQDVLGSQDLGLFATNMETLGEALNKFATKTAGIDASGSAGAIAIARAINAINLALPLSGGILQQIIGGQNLSTFASGITYLGVSLARFADKTAGIDASGSAGAIQIAAGLATINRLLPTDGGLIGGLFFGQMDLSTFANQIPLLGYALRSFSDVTAGIDPSGAFAAIIVAQKLSDLMNVLPGSGGLLGAAENLISGGGIGDKVSSFKQAAAGIADALNYFSTAISSVNLESITTGIAAALDLIGLVKRSGEIDPEASDNLVKSFNDVVRAFNKLGEIDTEAIGSVVSAVTNMLNALVAAIQSFYPVMTNLGLTLMLNLSVGVMSGSGLVVMSANMICTQFGTSLNNGLTKAVSTASNNLNRNIMTMLKMVLDIMRSYSGAFQQAGLSLMQAFANGINSGRGSVVSSVSAVVRSAASSLSGLSSAFASAGYDCMAGFARGIRSGTYLAIDAAATSAARALKAAKNELGVKSPSREFKKVGMYSNMGFANGLIQFSNLVEKAGESVGQTAIDSVDRSASRINKIMDGTFGSGVNFAPVVTADSVSLSGLNTLGSLNRDVINSQMKDRNYGQNFPLSSDGKLLVYVANTDELANRVYVDGAVVNDDAQMRTVTKDFLVELSRKADL